MQGVQIDMADEPEIGVFVATSAEGAFKATRPIFMGPVAALFSMSTEHSLDEGPESISLAVKNGTLVVVDLAVRNHAIHVCAQHLLALVVP